MHISSGFRFQPDICKFFLFWFYLFVFHWRLIALQCCVRSCCTTAWNSCQWQVWIVSWVSAVFKAFSVLLRCVLWFATQWPVWERAVLTYITCHLSGSLCAAEDRFPACVAWDETRGSWRAPLYRLPLWFWFCDWKAGALGSALCWVRPWLDLCLGISHEWIKRWVCPTLLEPEFL